MNKLFFLCILLSGYFAKAETYYLNDFLFHLQAKINNSKDVSEMVSHIPGTLDQKSSFVKTVRDKKLAQEKLPKAEVHGTKLEINLTPKLVIDFAQLEKLVLVVNGKTLDLKKDKDWMGQFNKAYHPEVSWMSAIIEKAYAEEIRELTFAQKAAFYKLYALDALDQNVAKPMGELATKAISKASDIAGTIYVYSVGTYIRCAEGIDDCVFFSHSGTIAERLTEGEYQGLGEFQCENGKLKKIQALQKRSGDKKNMPSYEFFYTAGSDDVKVKVQNYGYDQDRKANCEFTYNDKTKAIQANENSKNDRCMLWERTNLNTIGYDTPVGPAFRCCQKKSCEEKVAKFKTDFQNKLSKGTTAPAAAEPAAGVR